MLDGDDLDPIAASTGIGGSAKVTVTGRKTGEPQSLPIISVDLDGVRYLVSARGESDWVRNLRVNPTVVAYMFPLVMLVMNVSSARRALVRRAPHRQRRDADRGTDGVLDLPDADPDVGGTLRPEGEATSSVNTRTEVLIQRAMSSLRKGRTSFVIAHRLSIIRDADVILVMESGRIVEHGTHTELLDANGAYARLYTAQFAHAMAEMD